MTILQERGEISSIGIPAQSWMSYVADNQPLISASGRAIPKSVLLHGQPHHVLSLDIGNDAAKIGIIDQTSHFQTARLPAIYRPAKSVRYGKGKITWRLPDTAIGTEPSESFWIGMDALSGGDSLPIGPTYQRLADVRYLRFLKAALVEALLAGAYAPGTYTIALGLGVRNEEIEEVDGRQTLDASTLSALRQLKGTFEIERRDEHGNRTHWHIQVSTIFPAAQTLGSFFAWYYNLEGKPAVSDIAKIALLDYGSGDTHLLEVEQTRQQLTVTGERLGEGTVEIARGLIALVKERHDIDLTIASAQHALITATIDKGGRKVGITDLIASLTGSRVENVLSRTLATLQNGDAYLMHTGGGASLMRDEIQARMALMHRLPHDYLIVPSSLASELNCIGLYAFAYYRLTSGMAR